MCRKVSTRNVSIIETFPIKILCIVALIVTCCLDWSLGYKDRTNDYGPNKYERTAHGDTNYGQYGQSKHVKYGTYEHPKYPTFGKQNYDEYGSSETSFTQKMKNDTGVIAIEMANAVRVGQTVELTCKWKVGVKGFFSLRWYKNEKQLYSYLKGNEPQITDMEGISALIPESNYHVLTLREVTPEDEGTYKCEIMAEAPRFTISHLEANLTVVELPQTPVILGLQQRYEIGDTLNITCVASNGRPAPHLELKVNGILMQRKSGRLIDLPTRRGDRTGVFTSQSRLIFPLSEAHTPSFTLGCYANAHGLSIQKEINIHVERRKHFLGIFFSNGGTPLLKDCNAWLLAIIVLHLRITLV